MEDTVIQNQTAEAVNTQAAPAAPVAASAPAETEYPAMTMEDVLASEEDRVSELNRGDVVSGTVVFVGAEGVALDVGAKIEGTIPLNQLSEEPLTLEQAQEQFKPGDKIDAYVVRSDMQNGVIILSKKRAEQDKGWRKLQAVFENNENITVHIDEKVKGGLVANIEGVTLSCLPANLMCVASTNSILTSGIRSRLD